MQKKNRYGLPKVDFFKIIDVYKSYAAYIERVILFGSRARGDYKLASDIDMAIKFRNDHEKFYSIKEKLSQLNIIYTFDLLDYDKISNEKLKKYIDTEGKTIFLTNSKGQVIGNMNKIIDKIGDLEKALKKLHESLVRDPKLDDLVIDATIQRFEFTYELSWKLMKVYLEYNGNLEVTSPRRTIQEAFKEGIITEGDKWLKMLENRNRTSHTYDEEIANEIYRNIKEEFSTIFDSLLEEMKKRVQP
ncbi:nucleotidyltransferase [Anaerobacillus alkalidiazotrophicus]|uniref:Nucleotidyltransferase n=1 Tax=Anaerobacillus alkalidiazotrophicus TaxID=472963 RepID=A0A1S2MCN6_9BACI|nr:HI0074 family nucleotidyltransferase substrate-binding subunit [Anaerobacillus alkalidiazotrophicus]OIJ22334.1 nucleotidyltransferase [Anaerobacillus alkalidiazotrophicus]